MLLTWHRTGSRCHRILVRSMLQSLLVIVALSANTVQGKVWKYQQSSISSDRLPAQAHWRAALRGLSETIPGHNLTWEELVAEQSKSKSPKQPMISHLTEDQGSVRSFTGFRHRRHQKSRHHGDVRTRHRPGNFSVNTSSIPGKARIGKVDLERVISTILTVNGTLNAQNSEESIAWCHAKVDHLRVCCWFKDYEDSLTDEQLAEFEEQSDSFHGPDSELLAVCDKLYQVTCVAPDTRKVCGEKGLCDFMPVCASYQQLPPEAPRGMLLPHCGDAPTEGVEELWDSEPGGQSQDIVEIVKHILDSEEPDFNASALDTEEPHADDGLHWKGRLWSPHEEVVEAYESKEETGTESEPEIVEGSTSSLLLHHVPKKKLQQGASTSLHLHRITKKQNKTRQNRRELHQGASTSLHLHRFSKQQSKEKQHDSAVINGPSSLSKADLAERTKRAEELAAKKYNQALDAIVDSSPSLRAWQPTIAKMRKRDEDPQEEPTEEELEAEHELEEATAAEAQVEEE